MAESQSTAAFVLGQEVVIYRDVPGYPGYRVGSDGSVWSAWRRVHSQGYRGGHRQIGDTWRRMTPQVNDRGYQRLTIGDATRRRTVRVHRLILLAFIGPCPPGMEACHGYGNRANNCIDNLRWDTPKGNAADKFRHGTIQKGSANRRHKMTEADVIDARRARREGESVASLSRRYGVTKAVMSKTLRGLIWRHVGEN